MKTVPLLEVVKEMKRGPFGSAIKKEFFVPKGYKVYEQQNAIYDDPKLGRYFIDKKKYEELKGFAVKSGDFLISCSGTIGRITRLPNDVEPGVINQALLKITLNEEVIDPNYFLYLVRSLGFQNKLLDDAKGVAIKNVAGMKDIKAIPVPLFDLKTQKKIVQKIDSLFTEIDAGVEELKKTKEKLELYKQSVLNAAIRGKLVPQDPKDEPASMLLERIRTEKEKLIKEGKIKKEKPLPPIDPSEIPFELPKGWEWVRLQDLISVLGDGLHGTPTYTLNSNYYFINGNNLDNGRIVIKPGTKSVSFEEYNKYKKNLTDRTILVSINGTLGNVAFFNNEKIILGKSACYFNLIKGLEMSYIKLIIESPYYFQYAFEKATGSTIKNVSLASMRNLPVPLCSLSSQLKICNSVDTAIKANISDVHYIETQLMKANLLKQSILKQAFEGKLI